MKPGIQGKVRGMKMVIDFREKSGKLNFVLEKSEKLQNLQTERCGQRTVYAPTHFETLMKRKHFCFDFYNNYRDGTNSNFPKNKS